MVDGVVRGADLGLKVQVLRLQVDSRGEGLPYDGQLQVLQWWREDAGHEGLHGHDRAVRNAGHQAEVTGTKVSILWEQVEVAIAQEETVLILLPASKL